MNASKKAKKSPQDEKKPTKITSVKNKIRSVQRLLKKADLAESARDAQLKKLEELEKLAEDHARSELERKMALKYRKVKFFERRKIIRRIATLSKQKQQLTENLEGEIDNNTVDEIDSNLEKLKEDLEYVVNFPKTEPYISLFVGDENEEMISKRDEMRKVIKKNLEEKANTQNPVDDDFDFEMDQNFEEEDEFFEGAKQTLPSPGSNSNPSKNDDVIAYKKRLRMEAANKPVKQRFDPKQKKSQNSGPPKPYLGKRIERKFPAEPRKPKRNAFLEKLEAPKAENIPKPADGEDRKPKRKRRHPKRK